MKNKNLTSKKSIASVIEIYDFEEAAILRYAGHEIESINKDGRGPASHTYRFYFRSDTKSLVSDLTQRSLRVEPAAFLEAISDLLAHKSYFEEE